MQSTVQLCKSSEWGKKQFHIRYSINYQAGNKTKGAVFNYY